VISQAGQPAGQPDLKKPTALPGAVGVWDCENSDRAEEKKLTRIRSVTASEARKAQV